MDLDYELIGFRLRQARVLKKISLNAFSNQLDVSPAYLSRIENGKSQVSLPRLNQICVLLGISIGKLLDGTSGSSEQYLYEEFAELLNSVPARTQKLIYDVAVTIVNNEPYKK